jgi:4-amino-4-deoxy-L-arabinose transferase-like glycosyltransferase
VTPARDRIARFLSQPAVLPCSVLVGVMLRLFWIFTTAPEPVSDYEWYYRRAVGLVSGLGYQVDGRPTAFWPVGYPAFLALVYLATGPSVLAGQLANVLLYAGIVWLLYSLAFVLFQSRFIAGTTAILLCVYPNHIAQTGLLSTETLFLFLSLLAIWLLLKADQQTAAGALSGLIFGLACLVKPQAIFLPCVVVAAHRFSDAGFRSTRHLFAVLICVYACLGVTLTPWLVRDYRVFNGFVFVSTNGGFNLLVGNNPGATGTYMSRDELPTSVQEAVKNARNEYEQDRIERRVALDYLLTAPVEALRLWPKKAWYLYRSDGDGFVWTMAGIAPSRETLRTFVWRGTQLNKLFYMAVIATFMCALGALGVRLARFWGPPRESVGLAVIAYFSLAYMFYFGDPRFHFPVMPWVIMTVAALAARIVEPATDSGRSGTPTRSESG